MSGYKDFDLLNSDFEIKEQNRFLPIANVGRVMKKALPEHAKLSKDSKECIQECVSEFISFVTSQASDKCKVEKRKTLNGEDILWSMYTLGFENYAEALKIYLAKYREYEQIETEKKYSVKRTKRKSHKYGEGSEIVSSTDDKHGSSPDSLDEVSEHDDIFNFQF